MKLKGFDVDLFTIPDREFGAVRIARNRDKEHGPLSSHDYQWIIIQLLTKQAKMQGLLNNIYLGAELYGQGSQAVAYAITDIKKYFPTTSK